MIQTVFTKNSNKNIATSNNFTKQNIFTPVFCIDKSSNFSIPNPVSFFAQNNTGDCFTKNNKIINFFNKEITSDTIIKSYTKRKPISSEFYETISKNKAEPKLKKQVYSEVKRNNDTLEAKKVIYFYNTREDGLKTKEFRNCTLYKTPPYDIQSAEEIECTYDDTKQNISKKIIKEYSFNPSIPNGGAFDAKECNVTYKSQNEKSSNIVKAEYKDVVFRDNFTIYTAKKQISTYSDNITKGFENAIYYNELGERDERPCSNVGNETNVKCADTYIEYDAKTDTAIIYTNPSFFNGVFKYTQKEIK